MSVVAVACVDQHAENISGEVKSSEEIRIIATSNATLWICDALDLDLAARCATGGDIPERYKDLPEIGTAMSPDVEAIALLEPTDIIGPDTLMETIKPTYDALDLPYTFIDLQSVEGMYDSIELLGQKYGKESEAASLVEEYHQILDEFEKGIEGKPKPTVLMLMGLPGAYIECTPNSYCGSLIGVAGAESVVQVDDDMNFVSWNTEELLKLDPDYILLTVHGLPFDAMEMFAEEFKTNDIWQHFRAVQEGHVYELDYTLFGMSATFEWPKALNVLKEILYDGTYKAYNMGAS